MVSIIEVTCPHCGNHNKVILPPMGSILFGPCPDCSEHIVLFCGEALALDKRIMEGASERAQKAHLLQTLSAFLRCQIDAIYQDERDGAAEARSAEQSPDEAFEPPMMLGGHGESQEIDEDEETYAWLPGSEAARQEASEGISDAEVAMFHTVELCLIDRADYFKSIFR